MYMRRLLGRHDVALLSQRPVGTLIGNIGHVVNPACKFPYGTGRSFGIYLT